MTPDMANAGTTTLTIQAGSRLIEGYLHTSQALADRNQPAPVAVHPNQQNRTEALMTSPEGKVQQVSREPASDSGWNAVFVPPHLITNGHRLD